MALLVTDALVLHAFDYLESSRILRLATREAGVVSVLAKGARRSRSRYGSALDLCSRCHTPVERSGPAMFSHPAGGLVCARCARLEPAGRVLPDGAREALAAWLAGGPASDVDEATGRAHQRLLREFLREHLSDGRPLHAFEVWEHERWS